jgi:hypothetical protein
MSKRPSLAETMRQVAIAPEPAPVLPPLNVTAQVRPPEPHIHESGFYAATRVGKKKVTATLAPADHKRLRQLALEREITTEALLAEAINDLFAKYGKGAIGEGTGAS